MPQTRGLVLVLLSLNVCLFPIAVIDEEEEDMPEEEEDAGAEEEEGEEEYGAEDEIEYEE